VSQHANTDEFRRKGRASVTLQPFAPPIQALEIRSCEPAMRASSSAVRSLVAFPPCPFEMVAVQFIPIGAN
jgi:hypothetical protein